MLILIDMMRKLSLAIKWVFDRIVALIGMLFISPFMLVIFIIHKIKMPDGSFFFWQVRIGQYGKPFKICKIRTMKNISEDVYVTTSFDPRVTPFGRWLRDKKIDALSELFNVFVGQMSLVGPRPDVPGYADTLQGDERVILLMKPGLTGPASLKYRHEEELLSQQKDPVKYNDEVIYPDKVKINMEYYRNWSLLLDLKILFMTFFSH